jgi:anaerobic dimethyl sulfoxide reductase subunit B (iron-sulfur subunit)
LTVGQLGFFVDATRCINCRTCEVACKDVNDAAPGVRIRKVRTFEEGEFPRVIVYSISMSCNHCEDPVCVPACPSRAYSKRPEDGVVLHNPDLCIGCRYCTWVCPYGAPQYDPASGTVRKCNLCAGLISPGESPVCVASCPLNAIQVELLSDIDRREGATISIRNLPSPALTRPAGRYRVRAEALEG